MLFIICILFLIGFVIAYVKSPKTNSNDDRNLFKVAFAICSVVFAIMSVFCLVAIVPAGHIGVVDTFGTVSEATVTPGLNLVNPFASIPKFSVQTVELKETMDTPSKEGLNVTLEISVLYHVDPTMAVELYKTVGANYEQVIVEPQFRSITRGITAEFDAKALYTSERDKISRIIFEQLAKTVALRGIVVEGTPLRKIGLPAGLAQSIEAKLQADQESQRMQFILAKERQEADRKVIEAKGIADFQAIVTRGITESLLRWKGIEATEKLAGSTNTKVVIIGAGKDGLPLIMDTK